MKSCVIRLSGLLGVLLVAVGCQSPVYQEGEGGTYQIQPTLPVALPIINRWEMSVSHSLPKVHKAVLSGLKTLKIKPITNRIDTVSGVVDGLFADQQDFEIHLQQVSPNLTRISIRCGLMGKRDRALSLFRAIEKHL